MSKPIDTSLEYLRLMNERGELVRLGEDIVKAESPDDLRHAIGQMRTYLKVLAERERPAMAAIEQALGGKPTEPVSEDIDRALTVRIEIPAEWSDPELTREFGKPRELDAERLGELLTRDVPWGNAAQARVTVLADEPLSRREREDALLIEFGWRKRDNGATWLDGLQRPWSRQKALEQVERDSGRKVT